MQDINDLIENINDYRFNKYNKKKIKDLREKLCLINNFKSYTKPFEEDIEKNKNKEINNVINYAKKNNFDLDKIYNSIYKNNLTIIKDASKNEMDLAKNMMFFKDEKSYDKYIYNYLFHFLTNGLSYCNSMTALNDGMCELLSRKNFNRRISSLDYEVNTMKTIIKLIGYKGVYNSFKNANPLSFIKLFSYYLNEKDIIEFINATDEYSNNKNKKLYKEKYNNIINDTFIKILINKYKDLEVDQILLLLKEDYPCINNRIGYDSYELFDITNELKNDPHIKTIDKRKVYKINR